MITREADYALRVLLCLSALANGRELMTAKDLAAQMGIPYRFLRRIVGGLQTAGFVRSQKGRGGGLCLARPAGKISLLEVLRHFDPRGVTLNGCCIASQECARSGICGVHRELGKIQKELDKRLGALTFDKLA